MAQSDNYTSEIQSKRVEKGTVHSELQLLAQLPAGFAVSHSDSPFGVVITLTLARDSFPTDLPADVLFEVHIEGKYPFQAPKILTKTEFCSPSLADGRDLLRDIIGSQWTPSLTMNHLATQLPDFVGRTRKLAGGAVSDLGNFHLGHPMYLSTWNEQQRMRAFQVMEVEGSSSEERVLVITEAAVLVLEKNAKYEGVGALQSWANLPSVENITRSKSEPTKLTFQWKAMEPQPPFNQVFHVPQADALISLVSQNLYRLTSLEQQDWIAEEEVSASALDKVQIEEVLQGITLYETYIGDRDTPDAVTRLLELYQQAVEYFSAINDPQFAVYLDKLHSLLTDESVLQSLSSRT